MCGIAGIFKMGSLHVPEAQADLTRMAAAISRRGPDDAGVWCDAEAGIGFSHRRLSIVDLSPLGHQPMTSASGRYTITFNGEIYNYQDIKAELSVGGCRFRSTSDTEVLLAAVDRWGVAEALRKCIGMLAFGIWDRQERTLTLARDRFGEKPLYYGFFSRHLLFGSELNALRQHPAWSVDIDRGALTLLLRHGFVPAPLSIYSQVKKVLPGQLLSVQVRNGEFGVSTQQFWDAKAEVEAARTRPLTGPDVVATMHELLKRSVSRQMVADVPVGAFLSGGVDSSLIVSLMQQQASQPVRTFSIGFTEKEFDESPYARSVAQHLGTQHTELIVSPRETLDVIPKLPSIYDEPFADSSQIPTYLISGLARSHVTVSLSGDAGDELFGGYSRYPEAIERWRALSKYPRPVRALGSQALEHMPRWLAAYAPMRRGGRANSLDAHARQHIMRERAIMMASGSLPEFYFSMISFCQRPSELVLSAREPTTKMSHPQEWPRALDDMMHMMFVDAGFYMPDDVLVKVDRAAMAVSLETRVPFLDPDVARAAWRVPTQTHFTDGRGKWILRQILETYVPRQLIDRPKMGFQVPVAKWLRSELRPWADSLLAPARLRQEGIFDAAAVTRRWQEHQSGGVDWSFHLWGVLMFQAWQERWSQQAAEPQQPRLSATA